MKDGKEDSIPHTEVAGAPPDLFDPCLLPPDTRVGPYRILSVIHASRMSVVYRAERDEAGQPRQAVALKMPLGGRLISPEAFALFKQEMATAASMDHSAIVPVLAFGEHGGVPYYVMQFIEGRSLDEHILREKPSVSERVELFARICGAVQSLHTSGLVHRDIKPQNIMVDKYGDIRLLDFGLAKAFQRVAAAAGTDTSIAGTYQYMAPEQARGDAGTGTAADVYSLGVVLYLLLTDSLPYTIKSGQTHIARAITEAVIEPPSVRNAELTTRFDSLVMLCLEKRASRRPQTAGEVERTLQALLPGNASEVALASHASAWRRLALATLLLAACAGIWYMHTLIKPDAEEPIVPPPAATTTTTVPAPVEMPVVTTTTIPAPVETPVVTTTIPVEEPEPVPTTTTTSTSTTTTTQPRQEPPDVRVTTVDRPATTTTITTTTQPTPTPPIASIKTYTEKYVMDALRRPANRFPIKGIPKGMWGIYDETRTELSGDPYRQHGALLLRARAEATLIWQVGTGESRETEMLRGAARLIVPSGVPCLLTWTVGGQTKTIRISLARGEIVFKEL